MNAIKCENGHFFDGDKFSACPLCGAKQKLESLSSSADEKTPVKKSFFRKKEKEVITVDEETTGRFVDTPSKARLVSEDVESVGMFETIKPEESKQSTAEEEPEQASVKEEKEKLPGLSAEINKVKSNDSKTIGVFRALASAAKEEERQQTGETKSVDFPVGWLVCIKGVNLGKTYPISAGQNTIGRTANYTISLSGDNYVSASNVHAKLIYEPNTRRFIIMNGESSSLTYLNDTLVLMPQEIVCFDKISFGDINKNAYMLMPLCSDKFSWTDYIGA